jgi:hypothetical protein
MLTASEFQRLCGHLNLPKAGREVIQRIRERIAQSVSLPRMDLLFAEPDECGVFPSHKMAHHFPFLLGKDDLIILHHLEFNTDVLEYYPYPGSIAEEETIGGESAQQLRYPQFFVIRRGEVGWEDWLREGTPRAPRFASKLNIRYMQHAIAEFDQTERRTLHFLESYLRNDRPPIDNDGVAAMLKTVSVQSGMSLRQLCQKAQTTLNDAYTLMAMGKLIPVAPTGDLEDVDNVTCYLRTITADTVEAHRSLADNLVARLRSPNILDGDTFEELRRHVLSSRDQHIQKAAIAGLVHVGGVEAILVLTERLLDLWGCGAIERAIRALVQLGTDGGLLALSSTLLLDSRYYSQKLHALAKGAKALGCTEVEHQIHRITTISGTFKLPTVRPTLVTLGQVRQEDIAYGATLARLVTDLPNWKRDQEGDFIFFDILRGQTPDWPGDVEPVNHIAVQQACAYARQRIPGLLEVLGISYE